MLAGHRERSSNCGQRWTGYCSSQANLKNRRKAEAARHRPVGLFGYLVDTPNDIRGMHEAAIGNWTSLTPILPAVSGGLNPKTIGANVRYLGRENLFLAGTGILTHACGPKAGVEELRAAAESAIA